MISRFTILYNRTRQAVITGELVEIITVSLVISVVLYYSNTHIGCYCFGRYVDKAKHFIVDQDSRLYSIQVIFLQPDSGIDHSGQLLISIEAFFYCDTNIVNISLDHLLLPDRQQNVAGPL